MKAIAVKTAHTRIQTLTKYLAWRADSLGRPYNFAYGQAGDVMLRSSGEPHIRSVTPDTGHEWLSLALEPRDVIFEAASLADYRRVINAPQTTEFLRDHLELAQRGRWWQFTQVGRYATSKLLLIECPLTVPDNEQRH